MAYSAEISRANPTCILFVIDQSGSMADELDGGVSKAKFLADVLNRSLMELVIRCSKAEGVLNYFDVGVISYSGSGVGPGFGGALAGSHLCQIGVLARSPLRVETRRRKTPDGAGGLVETETKFPVWFDPHANLGTPMCEALRLAASLLADWCAEHPAAFPPVVLHVTDGEPTDGTEGEVERAARAITSARTGDGAALLLNLHVARGAEPVRFPASEEPLRGSYARMLFRMSSVLPPEFQERARASGVSLQPGSRGYVFNAGLEEIVTFFEIGTRPRLAGADR